VETAALVFGIKAKMNIITIQEEAFSLLALYGLKKGQEKF